MNARQSLIMLVEDNPDHAELTKACLMRHPAVGQVVHVADGEEAVAYLQRHERQAEVDLAPAPALVLLDLRLPKVSGLEVLGALRHSDRFKQIPVVVLSTSQAETDMREAYRLGVNGYTVKPLDLEQFQQLVADTCSFWLVWNRVPMAEVVVPCER